MSFSACTGSGACAFRVALGVTLCTALAAADPTAAQHAEAATAFDQAVSLFDRAEYAAAARAFLHADDLAPSGQSLENAIAAGRRASDHLLVATAAERAVAREPSDSPLATDARQALSEASPHLGRLELGCEPAPCSLSLDGESVEPGVRFTLPGTHVVTGKGGKGGEGRKAEQDLSISAGSTYRVLLHTAAPDAPSRVADTSRGADATTSRVAVDDRWHDAGGPRAGAASSGVSPAVFWVGTGVTVVLAGVTTGVFLDAVSAKSDLPAAPTEEQEQPVKDKIRRSDLLFGGTVVAAAVTAAVGLWLVDWDGPASGPTTAFGVAPAPGGAIVGAWSRY